jgi:hypothetical protein
MSTVNTSISKSYGLQEQIDSIIFAIIMKMTWIWYIL